MSIIHGTRRSGSGPAEQSPPFFRREHASAGASAFSVIRGFPSLSTFICQRKQITNRTTSNSSAARRFAQILRCAPSAGVAHPASKSHTRGVFVSCRPWVLGSQAPFFFGGSVIRAGCLRGVGARLSRIPPMSLIQDVVLVHLDKLVLHVGRRSRGR